MSVSQHKKRILNISRVGRLLLFTLAFFPAFHLSAQDTTIIVDDGAVTLPAVIVHTRPSVKFLLRSIKNDTSFYKAFKTLRIVGYDATNNIKMLDKKGNTESSYHSRTRQIRTGRCRRMNVLEQSTTGKMFDSKGNFRYATAKMYSGLFFTHGTVCNETNIVGNDLRFEMQGKSGMEKHKEQLKMLFFNPGRKIPGIPFIGDKLDIYDKDAAKKYDYRLDTMTINGIDGYKFSVKAKPGVSGTVIQDMTTWMDANTLEVLGRTYHMRYSAGVYKFDVFMEVVLDKIHGVLLPTKLVYDGSWSVILKGSERGKFSAELYNFKF